MYEVLITVLDACILLWLVGTWFYEGHHRRCTVIAKCPTCGGESSIPCGSEKCHGEGREGDGGSQRPEAAR